MNTAQVLPEKTTGFTFREWRIIPDPLIPNHYALETTTGNIICILIFPEDNTEAHTQFLNRIAAAPELEDIAEMFQDSMTGKRAEKSMIFEMVCNVLNRIK